MYEDVLGEAAAQLLWDEYPEAFQAGELQETIDGLQAENDRLRRELAEARRQRSTDPVQEAIERGDYVCPLLGRACLGRNCAFRVSGLAGKRERAGTGCALAVAARALHALDALGIEATCYT